jgi:hypothetical protein
MAPRPVSRAPGHHRPGGPGHLVGQGDGHHLERLLGQKAPGSVRQGRSGPARLHAVERRVRADDQQLAQVPVAHLGEGAIMQKAFRIITQHRLLSRAELACSSLVLEEATKTVATVTVREKHGGKCGGAPETAPRRFAMEIDLKTGITRWDRNYPDMEMRPIPR